MVGQGDEAILLVIVAGALVLRIHEKADDADVFGDGQGASHGIDHHEAAAPLPVPVSPSSNVEKSSIRFQSRCS